MRQDTKKIKMAELSNDCRLLVISHMPLAYAMAWRMRNQGISLEDLQQEGCLGLCEAALRYDETVDSTFATYASYWCRKMMLRAIHRGKTTADNQPEEPRQEQEDILRIGQQHRIADALQGLSPKEELVVRHFYGLNVERLSITEIAATLGISKARASAIHRHALLKLEKALMQRPLVDYLAPWLK